MNDTSNATSESARLGQVRLKLLHLHQTLLEMERRSFEGIHGSVNSGELLQLVINHPQFAWLRIISALVVQIDEMLDADEPASAADMTDLIAAARRLFMEPGDQGFLQKYQAALQQDPDVVMAHSALMKLLRSKIQA